MMWEPREVHPLRQLQQGELGPADWQQLEQSHAISPRTKPSMSMGRFLRVWACWLRPTILMGRRFNLLPGTNCTLCVFTA